MTNSSSPKVIAKSRYILKSENGKNHTSTKKIISYYSNNDKKVLTLIDYITGKLDNKHGDVNLLKYNGEYATEEESKKIQEQFIKCNEKSNIYQTIISFNNDYLTNNIEIRKLEKILMKEILPKYFKKIGFVDSKKMLYVASLHGNTKHLHFHVAFAEKQPNYKTFKNDLTYRVKGKIDINDNNFLKNQVVLSIERNKIFSKHVKEINKNIEELKKYFNENDRNYILKNKKDIVLCKEIYEVGKKLKELYPSNEKIKYNSIKAKEPKRKIRKISQYIYATAEEDYRLDFKKLEKELMVLKENLKKINEDNHNKNVEDLTYIKNKYKKIDSYILNSIANYSLKNFNSIKKDIITNTVHKKVAKGKLLDSVDSLRMYFAKNVFWNKKEIERSILELNKEVEKANKEFEEMFKNNEYERSK